MRAFSLCTEQLNMHSICSLRNDRRPVRLEIYESICAIYILDAVSLIEFADKAVVYLCI